MLIGESKMAVDSQRWSREHKARGQGQGHKKIRGKGQGQPFRGQTLSRQGQECSRPRTQAQVFCKKKGLHKKFLSDLQKRKTKMVFAKFPRGFWQFPT